MAKEVEKYKQKKDVLAIGKKMRKINRARKVLGMQFEMHKQKATQAREMLGQLDKGVQALLQEFPKTPTIELDNQEEEEVSR